MRVTQSMLSGNMLRNLNTSYGKMSKLQEQLNSGSKINRPSDDPVVAVKGMGYRVDVDKIKQYQRNIGEANSWLDTTDEALNQVGEALKRVKDLTIQAANDTNTTDDRRKIYAEITQIKEQLLDIGNTKIGDNYIFTGTHTSQPLYYSSSGPQNPAVDLGANKEIPIDVFEGIQMRVNTPGSELFGEIDAFMEKLSDALDLDSTTGEQIGGALGPDFAGGSGLEILIENTLSVRADVGARQNRVEMMGNRLDIQEVNVTKQMSVNEDTDYAAAITEMTTAESIHQASLSVGAKIIQQTLVDFMR